MDVCARDAICLEEEADFAVFERQSVSTITDLDLWKLTFTLQEHEAWMKLAERVSEQCYLCGDVVYRSPASLRTEELTPQFQTSAICLRMEHMMSVTDLVEVTKKMEGQWVRSASLAVVKHLW